MTVIVTVWRGRGRQRDESRREKENKERDEREGSAIWEAEGERGEEGMNRAIAKLAI